MPRVNADQRSRYTHQASDVTYGGRPMESGGVAGYGMRASATYQANFQVTIDCASTDKQYFMLPPFIYCNKYIVAEGGGGSPVADVAIADPSDIAGTLTQIIAAGDLSSPSAADTALASNIDVEAYDQIVEVEVTTAGTGYATLILKCDIVQTSWK
jgi:hypothetical protein